MATTTPTASPDQFDGKALLDALVAYRRGDFSAHLPNHWTGVAGKIADTFNAIVDFASGATGEFERVAKVVGREGRVTERIQLPQTDGGWGRLVAASNAVINDLAAPLGEMTRVIGLVAAGDLRQTVPLEAGGFRLQGQFLRTAEIVNNMVGQLNGFSSEVTRVAREVGTEGKLGGQAEVAGVSGTWKDLTDSVNGMASNLTAQVRNIAEVSTAIANGDLSKKITAEAKGEILELKNTVNVMVDQLSTFAAEVTRVAREVGTEGKLGGQAQVAGVLGTWKDLTENVNGMASNLTNQVRNIAQVTTAVAQGDLSRKVTVDVRGEMLELKNTINIMVDQLSSFAAEVTRVAREVGTEGKLGGQAQVAGVSGTWKDLTENVNGMAANLTDQVRNIAQVTTAVANGDLSKKIVAEAKGEILELKNTINIMVDQLSAFAAEVTRVAREVGTEGKLGGQAQVPGVSGTWKDLTENVNGMASNLTNQVRNIAEVSTAIANGDLSKKITAEAKGEVLELKNTVNVMVDQLSTFAAEVTRVAREVGTEGRLGGQAQVADVSGTWKDLTDNVNGMAANLTDQVRNIAQVTTAVANGDLSKKIVAEAKGEILELKNTINIMVDQLSAFAAEVTRVAREVGSEGKLGGQAQVPGISGTWKDLTDNVNGMASNLTNQVRNIAYVTTAVANGDLSKKIVAEAKGEILELKNTINIMVDQLSSFAAEVTRVAREVGTEGKLGGQAQVAGVSGTWKDLTDNVNGMASNLTNQVRNIAQVTTAVANGDLSKKITAEAKGEILELTNTINIMVDQLSSFAAEVTRVAREVGSEGKLGGQAAVPGISGTWKDLTDNVNGMASNLTAQVRNIADVSTAIANGDLSRKITADARGEILELKNTINIMVEQLRAFAGEVTRVAREVGTEGKLGGQAQVTGVSGTWKDLTDSVNGMATNLTNQVRNIAEVTTAVANGDLSKKITVDVRGEILLLKETVNTMVDQLRAFAAEVTRVAREVGTDGRLGGQAFVTGVSGTWKDLTDSVNGMAANLTDQVRNIAQVTTAVANGDLSKKIVAEAKGEILELKNTINIMVDQLSSFAAEVTRVAREVGTEGKLGGQGAVRGVSGTWKDLTDSVNGMATNLTNQVRGIAKVVTAVARGDLRRKLTVEAKGEIAELSDTINDMIDTLALFSDQVTSVAREVGVEGRLGGQANVPGAAGTWKDLTDNVNQLAANLTGQVRAIAEVATAVTKGDLSRSVQVEAKGEVGELKNNINEMIGNLRETTRQNAEQDWLKTNLARFTRLLQGQRDLATVSKTVLSELAPLVNAQHGIFYMLEEGTGEPRLKMFANYGFKERKNLATEFKIGEGLVGQCAVEKQRILLTNVPGDYIQITSGLGEAKPLNIVVMPIVFEGSVRAVVELGSFERFSQTHLAFFDQLAESMGIVVNTIEAGMKTEGLLTKSQSLAQELQSQQEELQQTNEELEEKAKLLEEQKIEVERKNREVEQAKGALEDKAEQLALTSKYKSEFLSNMSHELRTPLNSLLILSQQLSDNAGGNMTGQQVEYAKTIEGSGRDLLTLINEILDLSKIESGTVTLDVEDVPLAKVREQINRTFEHVATSKGLKFAVQAAADLPAAIRTDEKRLMQVLKNLLSNAFKFTPKGSVSVSVARAASGWSADCAALNAARRVIAFSIADTGIGIPADKHRIVFEAFQQADGSTSRKYGGTGLGLSISRELARLLSGELRLTRSVPEQGSTFTLYLPDAYPGAGGEAAPREPRAPEQPSGEQVGARDEAPQPGAPRQPLVEDDRGAVGAGDSTLLIVEDDAAFAKILLELAREKGFKGVVADTAAEAVELARRFKPDAVTLDILLPDGDGWSVLAALKRDPDLRHIPVDVISVDPDPARARQRGAYRVLAKPATRKDLARALSEMRAFAGRETRNLLIVVGNDAARKKVIQLIGNGDVKVHEAASGKAALAALKRTRYDCVLIEPDLPDMNASDLVADLRSDPRLEMTPIVVFAAKDPAKPEAEALDKLAADGALRQVKSPERLLDETSLFLHRVLAGLPEVKRRMIQAAQTAEVGLAGKKVLVVDDDVRNIYALTGALERHKLAVLSAEDGKSALRALEETPGVDLVLMDIMMPEMDGFETMRRIRALKKFERLPIIALTAKAMKGDREKCIEAGASDYVSKPVDVEQLVSLMRVWFSK